MSDCTEEHQEIYAELVEIDKKVEWHISEVHGDLVTRDEIERADEQLREAILGPRISHGLHAGERDKKVGMEHKVNALWTQAQNGGIHAKFSKADKIALYGPTVGAIAVIVAALLGVFS